jgi:hypothetical protein
MMPSKFLFGNIHGLGLPMDFKSVREIEDFLRRVKHLCNIETIYLITNIKDSNVKYLSILDSERFQICQIN